MPQFEVTTRVDGWVEADCRELGVMITARTLADAERTARRTAARLRKQAVFAYKQAARPSLMGRLRRFFSGEVRRDSRGR